MLVVTLRASPHPNPRHSGRAAAFAAELTARLRGVASRLLTNRASEPGREVRRRNSDHRGSGPGPSCCPSPDPTVVRGTSGTPGRVQTVRVGLRRRPPPRVRRALSRHSLRSWLLRGAVYFSRLGVTRAAPPTKPTESRCYITAPQPLDRQRIVERRSNTELVPFWLSAAFAESAIRRRRFGAGLDDHGLRLRSDTGAGDGSRFSCRARRRGRITAEPRTLRLPRG